jgi:heme-degrading monooxygenase HmoA
MFTRIVEINCKPGKAREFCQMVEGKVVPIMRKVDGYRDGVLLISQSDSDRVLSISFWNSRQDAERYQREQFPKVLEMLRSLYVADPQTETYDVAVSTAHQITTKAA